MKRFIGLWLVTFALVLFAAAACFAAPADVKISGVQGDVSVMKPGGAWQEAANGLAVTEGAKVKAGPNSSCLLGLKGGHVLKVTALTTLTIEKADFTGTTETNKISIDSGKMFAKVNKLSDKKSTFQVKTPTAVAGVRGSEIMVEVGENTSSFKVTEGSFDVAAEGVEVILDQNVQVDVQAGAPPPEPQAIPEAQLQDLKQEVQEIKTEMQDSGLSVESTGGEEKKTEAQPEGKGDSGEAVDSVDNATQIQDITNMIEQQMQNLEPGTGGAVIIIE